MRHIFYLFVLAALFVPAGYFGSEAVSNLTEMTEARQQRERLNRSRIMRILKADERYLFQQVVVGPGDDEIQQLDFRARAYRDGVGQAAYGAIRASCPPPAEDADCWELASLYVDGVSVHQGPEAAAPADYSAPAVSKLAGVALSASQAETTTATLPPVDEKLLAAEPARQAEAPAVSSEEVLANILANNPAVPVTDTPADLRPTHSVRPSLVNARAAPRGNALAQLPRGTPLHMLDRQGGWGQFRVLDGEEAGLEIWIALSVLDSL